MQPVGYRPRPVQHLDFTLFDQAQKQGACRRPRTPAPSKHITPYTNLFGHTDSAIYLRYQSFNMSSSFYPVETTGTITSTWVPLTTTFSAPASCSNLFREVGDVGGGTFMAYDPGYSTLNTSYTCNPSAAAIWWAQYTGTLTTDTTRIGIGPMVCPQSWSVVQTSIVDSSSTFSMCCPS